MSKEIGDHGDSSNSDLKWLCRTGLILKDHGLEKLQNSHVLVVGLGGVGSFAAEALARSGIGEITIVDGDSVDPSNRNRQLCALSTTHGLLKADVMEERMLAINPTLRLNKRVEFLTPEKVKELISSAKFDFVLDCIDSISPKCRLIAECIFKKRPFISSMGAGGCVDPSNIKYAKLSRTEFCPLAGAVRSGLKLIGVNHFKKIRIVYCKEPRIEDSLMLTDGSNFKKSAYGTMSYMPAIFGLYMSSFAIRKLTGIDEERFIRNAKPK